MVYLFVYLFLGIPTGALFLWLAVVPETLPAFFKIDTVPVLVRGIAGLFGIVLTAASLAALRHGVRLQWIIQRYEAKPVRVSVAVEESSDTTTYTATVNFIGSDENWKAPIYYNKAVDKLLDRSGQHVEAWSDPSNGSPMALRVDGRLVLTYPKVIRSNRSVHP